jgi:phosphopantetheinyl transferase
MLAPLPVKIAYDPNGKPLLDPPSHHISVSHAGVFAAAVYSEKQRVGIDIEQVRERIVRVKERFLSEHELVHVSGDTSLDRLYVYWGGKEALYKLRGVPGLDFRNEIQIHPFDYLCDENQECTAHMVIEGEREEYRLFYSCVEDYMLVVGWKG